MERHDPTSEVHMMLITTEAFAELARVAAEKGIRIDDAFAAAFREYVERHDQEVQEAKAAS